jgi:putative tryptophan/tyrosine transport system substrate-binding protein
MTRRACQIGFVFLSALLAATSQAAAQAKLPRLCFITFDPGSPQEPSARFAPFFTSLREIGYVHGQSITISYFSPDGRSDQFPRLVDECLKLKPNVIAASTTPAALAAKAATRTVPIVMVTLADPVRTGLVASLAAPGGNVTGMSNMASELAAKRLSILKEAVPSLSRVLVLTYNADPIAPLQVESLKEAAPQLGVTLLLQDIRSGDDIPRAVENGLKDRADALMTLSGSIFVVERKRITDLAARHRLPAIYTLPLHVADAGGLMAYHADEPEMMKRAAGYVDSVLKGAKPAELPVQQPTKFKLLFNLKTAKALNLTIPPSLLALADEVIE